MQRIGLLMILAVVPLLCASMLAQSSSTSVDATMRASLASGNYESAKQCFHGQWFSTSEIPQESFCTMNGFLAAAQPARTVAKRRVIVGQSKLIHDSILYGRLQPVYEKLTDAQLVAYSRSDTVKLYFLRPSGQILNQPDRQKIGSQSEFAREWKQSAKAAEIHSVAQSESAENFRAAVAARTLSGTRRPTYYQRDGDSENNCLISEEDAKPPQQHQGIVVAFADRVGAGMKDELAPEKIRASEAEMIRSIEFSQIWSEFSSAAVKANVVKVKSGVAVK